MKPRAFLRSLTKEEQQTLTAGLRSSEELKHYQERTTHQKSFPIGVPTFLSGKIPAKQMIYGAADVK